MASAYLTPYQGTDFTWLCQLESERRGRLASYFVVTGLFLALEGYTFSDAVYYYPDTVPVIISSVLGFCYLIMCSWLFYQLRNEPIRPLSESQP